MFPLDYKCILDGKISQSYIFWCSHFHKAVTVSHSAVFIITVGSHTISSWQLSPKIGRLELPQSHKRKRKSWKMYPRFQRAYYIGCKKYIEITPKLLSQHLTLSWNLLTCCKPANFTVNSDFLNNFRIYR